MKYIAHIFGKMFKIVYYEPRERTGTTLKRIENTRVDKIPLRRGSYAIFYSSAFR